MSRYVSSFQILTEMRKAKSTTKHKKQDKQSFILFVYLSISIQQRAVCCTEDNRLKHIKFSHWVHYDDIPNDLDMYPMYPSSMLWRKFMFFLYLYIGKGYISIQFYAKRTKIYLFWFVLLSMFNIRTKQRKLLFYILCFPF